MTSAQGLCSWQHLATCWTTDKPEQVAAWGSWTFPVPVGCQKLAVLLPGTLQRLPSVFSALKRQQSVVFTHLVFL